MGNLSGDTALFDIVKAGRIEQRKASGLSRSFCHSVSLVTGITIGSINGFITFLLKAISSYDIRNVIHSKGKLKPFFFQCEAMPPRYLLRRLPDGVYVLFCAGA